MRSPILSKQTRLDSLKAMSGEEALDVLVIGGGVTGAGIAFDAATRGLRTGIVEAQDWSAGTSSRSSKLVHGGLRYLYQLDFKLVAEALRERGLLLERTAPHLVKAQPFIWPLKDPYIQRAYSATGIAMYDAMAQWAHRASVPIQKHYSQKGAKKRIPSVKADVMRGAIEFYDARVDDSRLVVTLVRSAVQFGAYAASRTQVVELTKDSGGRINGAVLEDLESGERYTVKAKHVINATGVWTEQTQSLADTSGGLKVLASKGIHIVVPREKIRGKAGIFTQTEKSVLFIIPWKRYWIIGTTDTKYRDDLRNPVADKADIDYVLEHANAILEDKLTHDDILGTYCGLRPLLQPGTLDGDKAKSTKVSREHTVTAPAPGLTVIAGGKLTTYRPMAEDAVDFALGKQGAKRLPSRTKETPLVGAAGYFALWNNRERLAQQSGLSVDHIEDLLDRYGSETLTILEMIEEDPSLGEGLGCAPEYLRAEIAFGVTHEGALHLEDLLRHRTRLVYEHRDQGQACLEEIADITAPLLEWDDDKRREEIESYREIAQAEAKAAGIEDEAAAQDVRAEAADITPMHDLK